MTIETYYGKITANKAVLNYISEAFSALGKEEQSKGYINLANISYRDSKTIYNMLEKAGYYKDL